ncbi:MAG: matrixin family metalloprotease, partial [Acidobacteria bacterium]|nr:matrixin family metalloprotease [Acidobacteriota bacterium]
VGTDGPSDLSSIAGLRWRGALPPAAKVSVETRAWMQSSPAQASLQVITMHPDVARADAEALVAAVGGLVDDRASLGGAVVLASVTREAIGRLADADAVAWIVPANEAMAEGREGHWCTTMESVAGLFVAEYAVRGEGWDGLGRGQAELTYFMGNGPSSVDGAWGEVQRAMAEWSRHAALKFTQAGSRRQRQSIDIDWLPARHAEATNSWTGNNDPDFSPNVLAHAFYPDAPEPYAGDVHFNDELFRWHIGGPTYEGSGNVFDVALHELGHSLGLAHTSDPNAVMYAYLGGRTFAGLTADDIAAIQTIYKAAPFCEMDVLPARQHVGHEGGRVTFDIVAGPGCTWAVNNPHVWMANEGVARGVGSGRSIIAVGRNTTTSPREGELRIADRMVTITQDAMPCVVTLSPTSFVIDAQRDEEGWFPATSSYWCAWVARSTVPWITVSRQVGNAVYLRFATNLSLAARQGVVRFGTTDVHFEQRASSDEDADGLPDTWERLFGLDPAVGEASADADGDGITNAAEFAAGTHPNGAFERYFAEGATSAFFSTRFAFVNPGETPVGVLMQFQRAQGPPLSHVLEVAPRRRATLDAGDIPGLEQAEFSTRIDSHLQVAIDRTLTWDAGGYGSHAETAIAAPSTTWFFAEGATHSGFQLFYLLQNPGSVAIDVAVTYLRPAPAPPIVKSYTLPPVSRTNIWVNTESADLAGTDVSATLTSGAPFIAERALYRDAAGQVFGAGHAAAGVVSPSTHWYFAEGATGSYLDTFLLIANPALVPADVRVTYLRPGGHRVELPYTIAPQSRFNIWVDFEDASLADTPVSMVVTSQNGVGVVAERAMWWPGGAWHEAHVSPGTTSTGVLWAVAEGEVGGAANAKSYVLVANPTDSYVSIRIDRLYADTSTTEYVYNIPPNSRYNIDTTGGDTLAARQFGMLIESVGGASPPPIVVERAMYSDAGGVRWAAGSGSVATKIR